jgi:hypothetical protein
LDGRFQGWLYAYQRQVGELSAQQLGRRRRGGIAGDDQGFDAVLVD